MPDSLKVEAFRAAAAEDGANYLNYKGLRIHAAEGLHERVVETLGTHTTKGAAVLDLASGSGALSLRLRDAGFDVTATDVVSENFRLHGQIPFVPHDLNQPLPEELSGFSALTAVEIMEHLENPRGFFRICSQILVPSGLMLVTTPNIGNPISKAIYLRSGTFQWFAEDDYGHLGHIVAIPTFMMLKYAEDAGFELISHRTHGDPYERVDWPKIKLLARLVSLVSDEPDGEISIFVFRKA